MIITLRSPNDLRPHRLVRDLWELPADDSRYLRIVDSIKSSGILDPLKVTEAGEVGDGRHRLRAAKLLKIESVPCVTVDESRIAEIAMETRMARRHLLTPSQLAWEMYPLFARRHDEARKAQAACIRQGGAAPITRAAITIEDLALELGVGRTLFKQAGDLHRLFTEDPELRAEWEPRIMCEEEPLAIGAVIAGIAGRRATAGKTPVQVHRNTSLHRWDNSWTVLAKDAAAWARWTPEEQEHATSKVRETIETLPEEVLDVITNTLKAVRRQRSGN